MQSEEDNGRRSRRSVVRSAARGEGHRYTYSTRGIPLLSSISLLNDSVVKVLRLCHELLFLSTPCNAASSVFRKNREGAYRLCLEYLFRLEFPFVINNLSLLRRGRKGIPSDQVNISDCFRRESVTIFFISRFSIELFLFR